MKEPLLMPGAEPFFFPGGKTGCLLVHGFTGAPFEMRWIGEYLANKGYTVLGVRLAGHGTRPEDLVRARWWDWLASVEDGLNLLACQTEVQFLAGLSMGAALSLITAARKPVRGVIAMSTPYAMPEDWRINFIRPISRVYPRLKKGDPCWRNQEAAADHVEYPYTPTAAIAEVRDLLAVLRQSLPKVRVPVLMAHSRDDNVVDPSSMTRVFDSLGSEHKEMLWVEDCNHVIVREPQRMTIFAAAADFIERVCKN